MDKLFTDSETFTQERPNKITQQQQEDFYNEIAEEIIENNWSNSDLEDVVSDVSKITFNDSGYEIAKDLEGYDKDASYDIDSSFIEFLEHLSYRFSEVLKKNVRYWVETHNPQPKFSKGTKLIVETPITHLHKKDSVVFVTGHDEKHACYYIHEDSERNGGYVLNYEDIESKCKLHSNED